MISKARALRAYVGLHLICTFPLLASACSANPGDDDADPGADAATGGSDVGSGGSSPGAGGASAAAGTPTATGGMPTTTGGMAPATAGMPNGVGGTIDSGGTASGGSMGGRNLGGKANMGGKGNMGGDDGGGGGGQVDPDDDNMDLDGPVAYGITIAPNGTWMGIENPDAEIAALIASGAKYVRFSRAAPSPNQVGIPDETNAPYARQMIKAGLKLGCVLIAQNDLPVKDLVGQGKDLKDSGFFDWIFVDGALTRKDIQQVIDGLHDVGWARIMVNDTLFQTQNAVTEPPLRVWGHSKAFGAVNTPDGPAVTDYDAKFINWIHENRPGSHALLKLEIDSGVQKFMKLTTATQIRLLTDWQKAQAAKGFTMIYPLFTTTYDSKDQGTYETQLKLIKMTK